MTFDLKGLKQGKDRRQKKWEGLPQPIKGEH
jgi:hypothetical protein